MKRSNRLFLVLSSLLLPLIPIAGVAEPTADKTLSPYFLVKSSDEKNIEQFPLKDTSAEVTIAGTIADVKVTQSYKNEGSAPIEATYVFPGSTRAAVYGMEMTIGERRRIAKIKEKKEAVQTYEKAKSEGKSASLLEEQRPNVFQMKVANIMPGDNVKVELRYTEHLVPTDGVYEFVYPTVVGPRYSNQKVDSAPKSEHWIANPYLTEGNKAPYTFGLSLTVDGAVPLQDLASPSHKIDPNFITPSRAEVKLSPGEESGGNKDFVLRYRLKGEAIQTGMLLTESDGEKFFLLMAQPPMRVAPTEIPPRDYVFVIDVSGSMYGFPLEVSKTLLRDLISQLRPTDTFNVLLFSGGSQLLSPNSIPATSENIARATALIDSQDGGGGTELLPALKQALAMPASEGRSRSFVVVTDGYVSIEREALELVSDNLNRANVFAFGIGTSVNRYLIEALAHAGNGEPFVASSAEEGHEVAAKFRHYIDTPVLTNLTVDFNGIDVYDVEPKVLPDLFAQKPVVVFGKYRGEAKGVVKLHGKNGGHEFLQEISLESIEPRKENSALRYLWARTRIARLSDFGKANPGDAMVGEITKLGLDYNLLTQYTSFVAVDDVVRNPSTKSVPVKQPLPLPQGVSNSAVGNWGAIGTGPEPETYALLSVLGIAMMGSMLHPALRAKVLATVER